MISNSITVTAVLLCITLAGSPPGKDSSTLTTPAVNASPALATSSGSDASTQDITSPNSGPAAPNTFDTSWTPLFNGKNLDGWKHVGPGSMTIENGLLRGHGGMGLLYWAGQKFSNCTFRIVYRMKDENDNSGIFIRIPIQPLEEWMPVHYGYEVQIDNHPERSNEDDYHITGTLYSLTKPLARPGKPGPEWNTMEITLDGPRTIVVVNGKKVTDYKEGDPVPAKKFDFEPSRGRRPDAGYFGLQNHSDKDIVFFKEISVRHAK